MDFGLRICGLPSHALWVAFLLCAYILSVHEDNQAMMRVVEPAGTPTMRYLHRTHRVAVARLQERFSEVAS
eukprot:4463561-Lingulodinium_polyedra.AAC.1